MKSNNYEPVHQHKTPIKPHAFSVNCVPKPANLEPSSKIQHEKKLLQQRLQIEAQRISNKHSLKLEKHKLAKDRFEFEKMCRLKELDMKKYKIESNEKLRILQLEKEERLEKLKLEYDFKVQMIKSKHTN